MTDTHLPSDGESESANDSVTEQRLPSAPLASDATPTSDRRGYWWGGIAVAALVSLAAAYLVVGPPWLPPAPRGWSTTNRIVMRLVDVFVVGWTLWVAASIGSFLNVVAYRWPLGRTLSGRSHCPCCDCRLSWMENTPVLGWLFLGGKCRHCGCEISYRYPLVEAAVGLTLGGVMLSRLYNVPLPHESSNYYVGQFGGPALSDARIWLLTFVHVTGLTGLWAMALIRWDGHALPASLSWTNVLLVAAILWDPTIAVEDWQQRVAAKASALSASTFVDPSRVNAVIRCLAAVVTAALMGRSLARGLNPAADLKLDPLGKSTRRLIDLIAMLCVVTLIVGWQSSIALVVFASLLAALMQSFARRKSSSCDSDPLSFLAVALPVVLAIQLCIWSVLHRQWFWPSDVASPRVILVWAAVALCIPLWLNRRMTRDKTSMVDGGDVGPMLSTSVSAAVSDEQEGRDDDQDEEDEVEDAEKGERDAV